MSSDYVPPDDCHSPRGHWALLKVLDDGGPGEISLALGRWEKAPCLAMRWNGTKENKIGNPQSRGIPTWFIISPKYTEMLVSGLPSDQQILVRSFIPERPRK